jgi:glyoxylate/hydroxypyruvate reductase A
VDATYLATARFDGDGLTSAPFFERMRTGSILIHLGRGDHLVEDDLTRALDKGTPEGAALDVCSTEPLPKGHPP